MELICCSYVFVTDLQFSTDDDEEFEEVDDFESIADTLGQGEGLLRSSQPVNYAQGMLIHHIQPHSRIYHIHIFFIFTGGEEDSKQAAEAMVQLSAASFYNQQGILNKNTMPPSVTVYANIHIKLQTNPWTLTRTTIHPIS